MTKMTIEEVNRSGGLRTMRIGGFSHAELAELKSTEHIEAKEILLEMLDRRNGGVGTQWMCGYGVYGLWFDNEYAYLNIGTSCD